jgi:2-keto-4-pentenoate hydratase/2-oxohepta-3-ene-1,7-dioic acid hydratase in catechol pathway
MHAIKRYVRFDREGASFCGLLEGDKILELKGTLFDPVEFTGRHYHLGEVQLLVPCEPSKVLAVGLNYASHRQHVEKEEGVFVTISGRPAAKDSPVVFAKFPSSLIPDGAQIVLPPDATNVHFEGELALVIGKQAKDVPVEKAREYVFGVSIANDLVDREWLLGDLQWFRAKGADGFGPMGPAIVCGLDYRRLALETRVNGQIRQSSSTAHLVFSPDVLLSYISRYVTLMPGDVIFTGTPGETQQVHPGDMIEVSIEHVGTLSNRVVRAIPERPS